MGVTEPRSAVQENGLRVLIRARTYQLNGDIFSLRVGGLRLEDRTIDRAAQKPLKWEFAIDDLALEFLPIISQGTPQKRLRRVAGLQAVPWAGPPAC